MAFRIQPHTRLHEWVAEENGYFRDEGLDYVFETEGFAGGTARDPSVTAASEAPMQVRSGAFEDMEQGRSSDVSCACHWAVNAASAAAHGKMYGGAYSVCPSGIFVSSASPYRDPADLAGVDVGVGYHSGSHYSAVEGLEPFLKADQITLRYVGRPYDRLRMMLDEQIPAVNVWGPSHYVLEQRGFRKLVDTTFVMGFLLSPETKRVDVERYFRGLLRAQQEIDLAPERYKHYWLREMPEDVQRIVDVRRFGPGERIVEQPYTRDMFERTHRWMQDWNLIDVASSARYEDAILA